MKPREAGIGGPSSSLAQVQIPSCEEGDSLLEKMLERENLLLALRRVEANKGAPGVDGVTVAQLRSYIQTHWADIRQQLLTGTYKPQPVRRVEIPKPGGEVRGLGIPTVIDRFIQQALLQVLNPIFDPEYSDNSFGFPDGPNWLLSECRRHGGWGGRTQRGMDITSRPLSPLLTNIMLYEFDKELEKRGHRFVRYADDCNVYMKSRRAGERVMASLTIYLEETLKRQVNQEKSAVDRQRKLKLLGFRFLSDKLTAWHRRRLNGSKSGCARSPAAHGACPSRSASGN